MPMPAQSWTVSCRSCDLIIGTVEGGRFVHDAECARPLTIGAGRLRCCECGGPLDGRAETVIIDTSEMVIETEDDDPGMTVLPFARRTMGVDARQRL